MAKISLLLILGATGLLRAEAPDARDLVRRSVEAEHENLRRAKNYTFLQRSEERELDEHGKVKSQQSKTYDVTMLEGSSYRRLIERDDHPLLAKEEKKEQEKLRQSIDERRHESKAEHDRRVAEYDKRPGRNREMLREIPDAFDFHLRGEELVNGRLAYVIEGTPHAGYRFANSEARMILPKLKITAWIDKADLIWVRLHAEVIETVSWALCLVRLAPGAHFDLEQTRVNGEVWLPLSVRVTGSARVALFRKLNLQQEATFKNFRRFQTDSQVVSDLRGAAPTPQETPTAPK
jgi:hypothetical protein